MGLQKTVRDFRKSLRLIERELSLQLGSETSCCGVTLAQCHTLLELESLGECSLSDLSSSMGLDKSTLSRTIESLVKEGFVSRTESSEDRRAVNIKLSESGIERAASINMVADSYYGAIFSRIPKSSHAQVIKSLMLLASAMEEAHLPVFGSSCCQQKEK